MATWRHARVRFEGELWGVVNTVDEGERGEAYCEENAADQSQPKEPLCAHIMDRVKGVSHLDFILEQNTPEWFAWRKNLITDVARHGTEPLPFMSFLECRFKVID